MPGAAEGPGARIQESEGRQLRIARQNDFLGFIRCVPDTESSGSLILAPGPSCKASANDFILLEFRSGEQVSTPSSASLRFGWATPLIPLRRKRSSVDGNIVDKVQRAAVPNLDIAPTELADSSHGVAIKIYLLRTRAGARLCRARTVSPTHPFAASPTRPHAQTSWLLDSSSWLLLTPPGTRHNQGTFHRAKPKTLHDLAEC